MFEYDHIWYSRRTFVQFRDIYSVCNYDVMTQGLEHGGHED
jgi:hypothetical protein